MSGGVTFTPKYVKRKEFYTMSSYADGKKPEFRRLTEFFLSCSTPKQLMLSAVLSIVACFAGFTFCSSVLPYTELALSNPLPFAAICGWGGFTVPFVFLGTVFGTFYSETASLANFLSLTLAFVLRIIFSMRNQRKNNGAGVFSDSLLNKTAGSAVVTFALSAMYLPTAGINGESAVSVLSLLITVPLLTLVFSVFFAAVYTTHVMRFFYELSMLSFFSVIVYCFSDYDFILCSMGTVSAVFFTLCIARYGGPLRAALFGFVLGYIALPTYFLPFILLGVTAGLVFSFGVYSACGISAAVACVSAIFMHSASAFFSFIPETVLACALTSSVLRFSFLPKNFPFPLSDPYRDIVTDDTDCFLSRELSSCFSLSKVSAALKSIPSKINEITSPADDKDTVCKEISGKIRTEFCENCPMSPVCYDSLSGNAVTSGIKEMVNSALENKNFSYNDIPSDISVLCVRLRELSDYVTALCGNEQIPAQAPVQPQLTLSYPCVAEIISSLANKTKEEAVSDKASAKIISHRFRTLGITFSGLTVIGKKRRSVIIFGCDKSKLSAVRSSLLRTVSEILGGDYMITETSQEDSTVIFSPAVTFATEAALSGCCKQGQSVSGDTSLTFNDDFGNFYAMISDGMGSGPEAAKSSALTAALMKNLIQCDISEKLALKIAGEALMQTCDECFATVDLIKVDLVTGLASVTKNYAASSYLLRNGSVYRCNGNSLPIGIESDADPSQISFRTYDGDTVIMVSDGIVSDSSEDDSGLCDVIGLSCDISARELADRILGYAVDRKGKTDDMSALVIKIRNKRSA